MKYHQKSQNFTLIELLVVIAIIAILASMLLPALNKARETAKTIACVNNLHGIGQGMHLYADDFDGYYPANRKWSDGRPRPFGSTYGCGKLVSNLYKTYIQNPALFYCPSAKGDYSFGGAKGWESAFGEAMMYADSGMCIPYFYNSAESHRGSHTLAVGNLRVFKAGKEPLLVEPAPLAGDNHGNAKTNVLYGDGHVIKLWRGINNIENYPYYYNPLIPNESQ